VFWARRFALWQGKKLDLGTSTNHRVTHGSCRIRMGKTKINTYGIVVQPLDVLLSVRRWRRTSTAAVAAVLERFVLRGGCRVRVLGGVVLWRAFPIITQPPTGQLVCMVRHHVVHLQTVTVVIVIAATQNLNRSSKSITLVIKQL